MKKLIKTILCIVLLQTGFCFVFAKSRFDSFELEELREKLVIEPSDKHWLLSKFSGWKATGLVTVGGISISACLFWMGFMFALDRMGLRDCEYERDELYRRKSEELQKASLITLVATPVLALSVGCITKKIVKKPFLEALEKYLKNFKKNKSEIPEELIPIFEKFVARYRKSDNKAKFIKKRAAKFLQSIFGEKIL